MLQKKIEMLIENAQQVINKLGKEQAAFERGSKELSAFAHKTSANDTTNEGIRIDKLAKAAEKYSKDHAPEVPEDDLIHTLSNQ